MSGLRISSVKIYFLAAASLLLASGAALAHGGGGGHGGGGHGGGHGGGIGHVGGFHHGGVGFARGGIGFNGGFARGLGYAPGFLYGRGYGLGYGLGYGYGLYGLGYGANLGFANGLRNGYGFGYGLGYGGYPYYGYGYPYSSYGYGVPYSSGLLYSTPGITGYSSAYPPSQAQATPKDDAAHLLVIVPENAELWFNGTKTSRTGAQREFVSPTLTPGKSYTYEIKARWMQDGKPVEQTRSVHVQANSAQVIDFTRPETPATTEK